MRTNIDYLYLRHRIFEIFLCEKPHIKIKILTIQPSDTILIDLENNFAFIVEASDFLEVSSDEGDFCISNTEINNQVTEHTQKMQLKNLSTTQTATFIYYEVNI